MMKLFEAWKRNGRPKTRDINAGLARENKGRALGVIKKAESLSERDLDIAFYMLRDLFPPHSEMWNTGYDLSKEGGSKNDLEWYIEKTKKHFGI